MFLGNPSLHFKCQASEFEHFYITIYLFYKVLASCVCSYCGKYPFHGEEGSASQIVILSKVHLSICSRLSDRFAYF